jgi:O-antigen/teichoic acid export membrane protein
LFSSRQFAYMPILLLASGILLLKSGVYARLLRVEEFGELSAALLVINTAVSFGALGFNHLAHKMLPKFHAANDQDSRAAFLAASIVVFLAVTLLALCGALVASAWSGSYSVAWSVAVAAGALTQFAFALQLIGIKSEFRFVAHSSWSLTRALGSLLAGAVVAWKTQSATAVILTEACVLLVLLFPMRAMLRGSTVSFPPGGIGASIRAHAGAAFGLLKLQGMITVLFMLDRWVGVSVLSAHQFGIYSVALIVMMAFENLQAIIGVPAYPVLNRLMAAGDAAAGYRHAFKLSVGLLLTGLLLCVPGTWILHLLVRHFLPQYVDALDVIGIILVAGILRVSNFFGTFCILADQERFMSQIALGIALVTVSVVLVAHASGAELTPVHVACVSLAISIATFGADFLVGRRVARLGQTAAAT